MKKCLFKKVLFLVFFIFTVRMSANSQTNELKFSDIIISIHTNNLDVFEQTLVKYQFQQKKSCSELLSIFNNTASSDLQRSKAAFYLGEWRSAEAINDLANNILLRPSILSSDRLTQFSYKSMPAEALVKIGAPSVPAVVRNLADKDNALIRDLSLQVLTRIDGDKDISQLRLQKALKAETDSKKQARLQAALKSLSEMK